MTLPAGNFIGHVRKKDGARQTLEDHLLGTASLTRKHAEKIGLGNLGELLGLLHDLGKYGRDFQNYLASAEGLLDQDCDDYVDAVQQKGKIDHSSAGAQYVWRKLSHPSDPVRHSLAQILALALASHHSGLIDCLAPDGTDVFTRRMNKKDEKTHFTESVDNIAPKVVRRIEELLNDPKLLSEFAALLSSLVQKEKTEHVAGAMDRVHFKTGLLLRMLFSCLIDGDRTDTANFESGWKASARQGGSYTPWSVLTDRLEKHLTTLGGSDTVNEGRRKVSEECRAAAERKKGFFTLTVPTGGGKTLASLRFALHHAMRSEETPQRIDRILYIIPYTAIIDQNAEVARNILEPQEDRGRVVLECHSSLTEERDSWQSRLLSENWDAPIVFTTNVQFLEALFAEGTRSVRRMHQLANSILIFDEIQTLPVRTVHMFCRALNFLVEHCGASAVLCTATQPLLHRVDKERGAIRCLEESEIVQDVPALFDVFRRVEVFDRIRSEGWSDEEIASLALEQRKKFGTCLVVVNTTGMARRLCERIQEQFSGTVHLSATMCPAHRRDVLKKVRECLGGEPQAPLICVATQVIEAGVDVDIGSVIRCLAGMDSMAQAAGRCNRHGLRANGEVLVVNPREDPIDRLVDIKVGRDEAGSLLREMREEGDAPVDLLHPDTIAQYFERYFFKRANDMSYSVTEHRSDSLLNMLSSNTYAAGEYLSKVAPALQIPLKQSFATAAKLFKALDASTRGIIVPYGEGEEVIADLCGAIYDPAEAQAMLRRAQHFSVNVFPNVFSTLSESGAIYEINGLGVWALHSEYYDRNFGLTRKAVSKMRTEVY